MSETFFVIGRIGDKEHPFLVDTGAFFSVVPKVVLEQIDAAPAGEENVVLADGSKRRWKKFWAMFTLGDTAAPSFFLGGDDPRKFLLGAHTLSGMGLVVDTRNKRLAHVDCVDICPTIIGGF